jgi:hypothetical protein
MNETKVTEATCKIGVNYGFGFLLYFPFLILSAIVLLLVIGSYFAVKATGVVAAAVSFLAPIEVMALVSQSYLASISNQGACKDPRFSRI